MFGGIVEELGGYLRREGNLLFFSADMILYDTRAGDFIAVNGCGLSVVSVGEDWLAVEITAETDRTTNLALLQPGDAVNFERSMRASERMRGHFQQGMVDGIGEIITAAPQLRVRIPEELVTMVAEKGAVSVDGVSLTVIDAFPDGFGASITDYTRSHTTLGQKHAGAKVNIEVELVAKYVHRVLVLKQAATYEQEVESRIESIAE